MALNDEEPLVTFDVLLRSCGDLNRFQYIHYFFLNIVAISTGVAAFFYVYGAGEPHHRCKLLMWPNDQYYSVNSSHQYLINKWIPKNTDGTFMKCSIYKSNSTNTSIPTNELMDCREWVYDRSIFGYTFTEEANMVCKSKSRKSLLAAVLQFAGIFTVVCGSLGDKIGRKVSASITTGFLYIILIITQTVIQFVPMSIDTKFWLLIINQFACGLVSAIYSITFVLMLELTSAAHTTFAANTALVSFTIGEALVTLFAYLCRNWQLLKWVNTIFIGLMLPYLYFMPESPQFLYSKKNYLKLEILLRKITRMNKKLEAEWYPYYQELLRYNRISRPVNTKSFVQQTKEIVTHKPTMSKLLIVSLIGFTTLLLYIKISYGLAAMGDFSPYIGTLIGAIVEGAGYVAGGLLVLKMGRKLSFIAFTTLTGTCILIIPFIIHRYQVPTILISQLGKFAISGCIAVSWIFVPELFPTAIRSSANGFFIAMSRAGAMLAPIIDSLVDDNYVNVTFYVYTGFAVIIILLSLFLPETKDVSLADAPDDISI
ncbi:unnamed protein product [Didymodactylos carnosus]|uniref:Major facilitator superfamily (MFS) profile domain-containing protein n=1 Tax=Didymodactylos carnosus TaxID=1234261 RepID=A0A814AUU7_9BILA|nr:unnamed protein product [Didymodactylos carnosus]CAF0918864.1 unnamed protein product [Didymodactylos carnosus]CAF3530447.1 unnamed protein product [Didymodactylos carnosus]CAF3698586.1 unnamed protein product [Didymodactylos carnosus]